MEAETRGKESGSDSDGEGYVTPGEVTFADDERPATPQKAGSAVVDDGEWSF